MCRASSAPWLDSIVAYSPTLLIALENGEPLKLVLVKSIANHVNVMLSARRIADITFSVPGRPLVARNTVAIP